MKLQLRHLLSALLLLIALFSVAFIALETYEISENSSRTTWITQANRLADLVIKANATHAAERGLTAAMASDSSEMRGVIRGRFAELRSKSDLDYSNLIEAAQDFSAEFPARSLTLSLQTLSRLHTKLMNARKTIDSALENPNVPIDSTEWIETMNIFIEELTQIRRQAFVPSDKSDIVYWNNLQTKEMVFLASEHAGRERAILSTVIAHNRPITMDELHTLYKSRGIVEDNLGRLVAQLQNGDRGPDMQNALDQFQQEFLGRFQQIRESVYAASNPQKSYPLDATTWWEEATRGINSILAMSAVVNQSNEQGIAALQLQSAQTNMTLIAVILIGTVILIFIIIFVRRRLIAPLRALTSASERIADGDLDCPVSITSKDEFGILGDSFECMRVSLLQHITRIEQAERTLSVRARQREVVAELAYQTLVGVELDTLMNTTVVLAAKVLEIECCQILEFLPDQNGFLLRAGMGWNAGLVGNARMGASVHSQVGYTAAANEPVVVENMDRETRFNSPPLHQEHGIRSGISVALLGKDQTFGVLGAHSTQQRIYTTDEIRFLQTVANTLAEAIERKQLEITLQEERTDRELLHAVATSSNEASNIESAIQATLDLVCTHTGWPVGHAYMAAADSPDKLLSTAIWHLESPERYAKFRKTTEETHFPRQLGLPGRVLENGMPAWITDITRDDNFPRARLVPGLALRAAFAFPVLVGTEVIAVLEFFSEQPEDPNQKLLDNMMQIGIQLGRVVERSRAADHFQYTAHYDVLTGLPNRTLLQERIRESFQSAQHAGKIPTLMLINMSRFREINEVFGHQNGDLVLQDIATRLREVLLPEDRTIARLGSDEFAVLFLSHIGEPPTVIAQKILDVLWKPFLVEELTITIEASMGISLYSEHCKDESELLHNADVAMQQAKRERSGYSLYAEDESTSSLDRLILFGELRHAIEHDELMLYYQPKVEIKTGRVTGVEALLRWQHPEKGLILPIDFIPIAEQSGLIGPLSQWVLRRALMQCAEWREAGFGLKVSVNLSPRNLLDASLPGYLSELLKINRVEPCDIVLEITEDAIMDRPERSMEILGQLHDIGVELSIDDFGTGHSSLTYLKKLPVDEVKIDKSFVMHMDSDENDAVIVRAAIDLGHHLNNRRVVAEGVETQEVWDLLKILGCDVAQGYLLSRPLPPEELVSWIQDSSLTLDQAAC